MASVDPFLCIVIALVAIGSAFISWYFFHKFQHPLEASRGAAWPQVVVIVSLVLTLMAVLLPPLDIANGNGGIPMDILWYIVFYTQATFIFLVLPYTIFYYGAYDSFGSVDDDGNLIEADSCQPRAWRSALCYTFITAAIVLTLIGVVWLFMGIAELDVMTFSGALTDIATANSMGTIPMTCMTDALVETAGECTGEESILEMDVTFPVYTIAVTAFLGWTLFAVFAGVGLFAIPLDMINMYRSRVTFMSKDKRDEFQKELGQRARSLHKVLRDVEEEMRGEEEIPAAKADSVRQILKEKEIVMAQFQNFKICMEAAEDINREENACAHCMGLLGGLLTIVVSLFWTVHIVLYMFWEDPVYGFLNTFLVELDNFWGFAGVSLYALFSFYLMLCVLKGNSKWGLSIGCFTLHPMEPGNTLMQSFLINTLLLALCSFSVVQFVMQAFKGYAGPNSASTLIFNVAARNLKGITVLYTNNVFVYILLITACLTFFVLLCLAPKPLDLQKQMFAAIDADEYSGNHRGTDKLKKRVGMEMDERGATRT